MIVNYRNTKIELPEWCKLWTPEEIERAAATLYEDICKDNFISYSESDNHRYDDIIEKLEADGYSYDEIAVIINSLECGRTLDSAIQSILK